MKLTDIFHCLIFSNHCLQSSFPDHTEKGNSTTTFSWKIPRLNEDGSTSRTSTLSHQDQLHGFVYFSQEKNTSIRRGYSQRSLAIITKIPSLSGFYTKLVNLLGPLYFGAATKPGYASSVVERALQNIYKW